jgi:hypothetical protein
MRLFSSTTPMNTNSGMAIRTSLVISPNTRWPNAPSNDRSKFPVSQPKNGEQCGHTGQGKRYRIADENAADQGGEHHQVQWQVH